MTTFTTEDREWAFWHNYNTPKYNSQVEIDFFWPLTEHIPLDLDYGPTHLYFRAKGIAGVSSMPIKGSIHEFTTVGTTTISPSLTINVSDSKGELKIGGINIGLNEKPMWYQRVLYKLLGFNWKDK